ncbi:hypothetical protein Q7P37_003944 [Cladosporium fusiforme]
MCLRAEADESMPTAHYCETTFAFKVPMPIEVPMFDGKATRPLVWRFTGAAHLADISSVATRPYARDTKSRLHRILLFLPPGRVITLDHGDKLHRVGAFANDTPGSLFHVSGLPDPARRHPSAPTRECARMCFPHSTPIPEACHQPEGFSLMNRTLPPQRKYRIDIEDGTALLTTPKFGVACPSPPTPPSVEGFCATSRHHQRPTASFVSYEESRYDVLLPSFMRSQPAGSHAATVRLCAPTDFWNEAGRAASTGVLHAAHPCCASRAATREGSTADVNHTSEHTFLGASSAFMPPVTPRFAADQLLQ